jgi:O-antigen/teichoic acid export membrane protein
MGFDNQISIPASNKSDLERGASLRDAKARIPRNVAWNWAGFAFNLGVTFLIAPLVVHSLGEVKYGIWALVGDFVGYSWLLGFGFGYAVVHYVARYHALREKENLNNIITTSLVLNMISSVLVMAAALCIAYVFPRLFSTPQNLVFDARCSVLLVAASVAMGFPASVFSGCLAAASRYDQLAIRSIVAVAFRALLLWYFLQHGYGLLAVALISTGESFLAYYLNLRFALRLFPDLEIHPRHFDLSMVRPLIGFSLYGLVLAIASRLLYMTDNLVVGFVLGPAAVTFYNVGSKLPGLLRDSLGNITKLFFPFASQMDALGEEGSLRRLYVAGSRIASLYVFPGVVGLVVLGPPFLDLWMGKPFGESSGPILIVLGIEVVLFAIWSTCGQVLYGMNRHKINAWLSLCNAAANFALSAFLVRSLGPVGVAWGTVIPAVLFEGIILPVYTAHLLRVPVRHFYGNAVLRPLAAAGPFGGWLWFCRTQGFAGGYGQLVIVTIVGLILYAVLAWRLCIEEDEKVAVRRWLLRFRSPAAAEAPRSGD